MPVSDSPNLYTSRPRTSPTEDPAGLPSPAEDMRGGRRLLVSGLPNLQLGVVGYLWISEVTSLGFVALLYRAAARPDASSFLVSRAGILCVCLAAEAVLSFYGAANQAFTILKDGLKPSAKTVVKHMLAFLAVLSAGEIGVRAFAKETFRGPVFAGMQLTPYVWKDIAAGYAQMVKAGQPDQQYFAFDSRMGWTVAPSSSAQNSLFKSSAEGIRSSHVGMAYASTHFRCRIALLGDSFVFGEESEFEKTWGQQLERSVGPNCQVLNFGVPGYSLGQMHMRYESVVRSFHPDVVVFGFTDGVVFRSLGVYGFLTFTTNDMPWPSPRFVLDDHKLKVINVPLISQEEIYAARSIADLPYVRYSLRYEPTEWEMTGWRQQLSRSYLFRTFLTLFPLRPEPRPEVSTDEVEPLSVVLFQTLEKDVRENGGSPLFVYFPTSYDYHAPPTWSSATQSILRAHGFGYVDLTLCLNRVDASRRFLREGAHYTTEGETAVANCLRPTISSYLAKPGANGSNAANQH